MDFIRVFDVLLAVIDICLLIVYLKLLKRRFGYFISPFNITIFITAFNAAISFHFYTSDKSWWALGVSHAADMWSYLDQSLLINLGGIALFLLLLIYLTQKDKAGSVDDGGDYCQTFFAKTADAISPASVSLAAMMFVIVFAAICLGFNDGSFPLLNGDRLFFYRSSISPIYLGVLFCLTLLGVYSGFLFVSKRKGLPAFLACVICLTLSGNRSDVLLSVILPMILFWISTPAAKKKLGLGGQKMKAGKKSSLYIVAAIFIILVVGLQLSSWRSGSSTSIESSVNEILDGNSFSDIRDGAFLIQGLEANFDGEHANGKTYLAAAISFIPSSMSSFREEWAWGRYSANKVAGFAGEHFGLRGGPYMEGYLNFGFAGVLLLALIQAYLFYVVDRSYRRYILNQELRMNPASALLIVVALKAYTVSLNTGDMYNLYVAALLVFFLEFLSLPDAIRKSKQKKREKLRLSEAHSQSRRGLQTTESDF